jgi:hypothetical protein
VIQEHQGASIEKHLDGLVDFVLGQIAHLIGDALFWKAALKVSPA